MSRALLDAYFQAKDAHTQLHKITGAFREGVSSEEILRQAKDARNTINRIVRLLEKATNDET